MAFFYPEFTEDIKEYVTGDQDVIGDIIEVEALADQDLIRYVLPMRVQKTTQH